SRWRVEDARMSNANRPAAAQARAHHPRSPGGLWRLVAGPATWAVHFLLSYVTVAVHCAKTPAVDATLGGTALALWTYTAVALAMIAAIGWAGWRQHRHGASPLPHDAGT